ncbi:MAG: translation initiation factor IF-3 [Candidatus Dadabacteria bacterium]|nr:MAG: translation initiation factor IF-3 [Candidatus Dadabacteria bacterium]
MATYRPRGRGRSYHRDTQKGRHRINRYITAKEVRLIGEDGSQLGVVPIDKALEEAEERGLDLVEVSPKENPPVCKIMDYGKFRYREQKKQAEARKKRTEIVTKELRIRYRTDVGDLETKLKKAREFLEAGDKVKFTMRFRGREIMYLDLGMEKFDLIAERLSDIATVEERSPRLGNQVYIVFAPDKKK